MLLLSSSPVDRSLLSASPHVLFRHLWSTAANTMAASASFLSGPAHFPRLQPPFGAFSPVGEPQFRGLSLASWPSRSRLWMPSVGTGIGGSPLALPGVRRRRSRLSHAATWCSVDGSPDGTAGREGGSGGGKKGGGPGGGGSFRSSSYAVPLGRTASGITRPLGEILRDLNKRVPPNIIDPDDRSIPWYHANRLLSFYAPGWCGEVRDVITSGDGSVTVVYRVTIRGSDGEAHRESTGTVPSSFGQREEPVAAAEEIAFCRACARFGLGLYLYHDDKNI